MVYLASFVVAILVTLIYVAYQRWRANEVRGLYEKEARPGEDAPGHVGTGQTAHAPSGRHKALFVSYSHADAPFVRMLAKDLRAAGHEVWFDEHDIKGGHDWQRAIEGGLASCEAVVVVLTPISAASEYVRREYVYALKAKKLVVPILRHRCDVPDDLRPIQYTDFTTSYDGGLTKLLSSLEPPAVHAAPRAHRLNQ
jgi:hypothetical protein